MIIYNMRKPVDCICDSSVGVVGENLVHTQEFYIKGMTDSTIAYTLHLRFADGSVNSVVPDLVRSDEEGTLITWVVKKNDIFVHGCFELQIEGRNSEELVFQTEIAKLYADESLPVENQAYANPNSETLKLRDEIYELNKNISDYELEISEEVLSTKEDSSNKVTSFDPEFSDKTKFPTVRAIIEYLQERYYDFNDTYSTEEIDKMLSEISTDLTQIEPNFANSIDECTDTSKVYVLPDNLIYAYMYEEGQGSIPNFTNQIPISLATDGNVYNGVGYKNDTRLNSSKVEATLSGASVSGYIPVSNGDIVRLVSGLCNTNSANTSTASPGSCNLVLYDSSFTVLSAETLYQFYTDTTDLGFENVEIDDNNYLVKFTINSENAKYLRITFTTNISDTDTQVVTVNEEITYSMSEGGYAWTSTGHAFVPADYEERIIELEEETEDHETRIKILESYESVEGIPSYWSEELETKADAIQKAMENAGRNKSAFLWYTDAHWTAGNSKMSPLLLEYLYKNTPMNKVNFGGDIIGDPSALTHNDVLSAYEWRKAIKDLPNHHSVIGNHDNLHKGRNDSDVANIVYSFLIAPEENADMVMGTDFCYYIDEPCEKTRYLYLDSGRYSLGDNETEFIIETLKNTPNGWHIVVVSHIWFQYTSASEPSVGNMNPYMQKALNLFDAYNARQSGSVTMVSTAKSYDFTSCGGKVEFCIGGHVHIDLDLSSTGGIPVIITASDVNQERSGDEDEDAGILGTITESAVGGIIADYDNNIVTVVGVGRMGERVINLT